MRLALLTALATLAALTAAQGVTPGNTGHHPTVQDNGCSLYVQIPNPCDPPSNN